MRPCSSSQIFNVAAGVAGAAVLYLVVVADSDVQLATGGAREPLQPSCLPRSSSTGSSSTVMFRQQSHRHRLPHRVTHTGTRGAMREAKIEGAKRGEIK